jgi:molybdate transport system permease protein
MSPRSSPGFAACAAVAACFFALPLLGLMIGISPRELAAGLWDPLAREAIALSLVTTSLSTLVVIAAGAPLAWWLAAGSSPTRRAVELIVELPIVLPPAVAGVALLLTYGRRGWLGGLELAFTPAAVLLAQIFVAAPFFVRSAAAAFRGLDPELVLVARSLGAGPRRVFWSLGLPLAWPGLAAGVALSWARALGEFGATLMFAGNLSGRTQTLPLAIYTALEHDLTTARALSLLLLAVAVAVLVFGRWVGSSVRTG